MLASVGTQFCSARREDAIGGADVSLLASKVMLVMRAIEAKQCGDHTALVRVWIARPGDGIP